MQLLFHVMYFNNVARAYIIRLLRYAMTSSLSILTLLRLYVSGITLFVCMLCVRVIRELKQIDCNSKILLYAVICTVEFQYVCIINFISPFRHSVTTISRIYSVSIELFLMLHCAI